MRSRSRNSVAPAVFAPFTAVLFLLGFLPRPATAQLLGPEFPVNSYTTYSQSRAAVAAEASGNFVVVWQGADGLSWGMIGRRFDSAGSPVGSEFQVNSYTTGSQVNSAVAADGLGNFVVVWESNMYHNGVFGQRFNSTGSPVGSEFQVNSYTASFLKYPAVAADASGNFVVVWQSWLQEGSYYGVFGQRFDLAGSPVGSEFQVNSYTTNTQRDPSVAADGSGNFVVVWNSDGQDGSSSGVLGQRFSSAGIPQGSEFQVNTYTTSNQTDPAVATDGSGNFVVSWWSYAQDGSMWGVFGQLFNSAGSPVGSEFQVNTYTTGSQYYPTVAADGSGSFVVVWEDNGQDAASWGVFGQRFHSAGSKIGSEFQVNSYTMNTQRLPAVAADGSGNFVVAWQSYLQDGDGYGVFGRRMNIAVFSDGFELGDVCAWSAAVGSGDVCPP